jgi:nucleotide-binding universal stress UspA family protein
MVATDGSAGASCAVDVAAALAKGLGAKLIIVTVAANPSAHEMRQLAHAKKDIFDVLKALSMEILSKAEKRAQDLGVASIEHQLGCGDVAKSIVEIAGREVVDAIVIGRRGRSELAGLLLGSVSQKVTRIAPCTVIVVPEVRKRNVVSKS